MVVYSLLFERGVVENPAHGWNKVDDARVKEDAWTFEVYFMQVDAMYGNLVSVGEYVKDTEEYINIELDSSRNRLIRTLCASLKFMHKSCFDTSTLRNFRIDLRTGLKLLHHHQQKKHLLQQHQQQQHHHQQQNQRQQHQ